MLIFDSIPIFVIGFLLLGRGKMNTTGLVTLCAGLFDAFLGAYIIATGALGALSVYLGMFVFIFAFTFVVAGIVFMRGYDFMALGNTLLILGIIVLLYAVHLLLLHFFITSILSFTYVVLYFLFTGYCLGKIKATPVAAWCFICALATLLAPGFYLLTGAIFA